MANISKAYDPKAVETDPKPMPDKTEELERPRSVLRLFGSAYAGQNGIESKSRNRNSL